MRPGNWGIMLFAALAAATARATTPDPAVTFMAQNTGNNIIQATVTGDAFSSRGEVEARLLLETARFTLLQGRDWFRLLPMPGEGPSAHPGPLASFPSWHAEWYFKLKGERSQRWRPHSGAAFWAAHVDLSRLETFRAMVLVEVGTGRLPKPDDAGHEPVDARAVVSAFEQSP